MISTLPPHLVDYEEIYLSNPREAARAWFKDAGFGMFVHYALASLLPRGKEGLQELMNGSAQLLTVMEASDQEVAAMDVSVDELNRCSAVKHDLLTKFTAEAFDAGAICDLAQTAGMKYVTFTTKHLGGLFLYENSVSEFNSTNAAAGRDLVAEVTAACARRGLGYFHYVPPEFARTDGDYYERNATLLHELLTNYGPVAGIWFDGIGGFDRQPENYMRLSEKFAMIRELQPHCLISFKEGAIGEEDFITPEHFLLPDPVTWDTPGRQAQWEMRLARWERLNKPRQHLLTNCLKEINTVMQVCWNRDGVGPKGGWINDVEAEHLDADDALFLLDVARSKGANLLMNVGPRGDGSVHPADKEALREVGRRLGL